MFQHLPGPVCTEANPHPFNGLPNAPLTCLPTTLATTRLGFPADQQFWRCAAFLVVFDWGWWRSVELSFRWTSDGRGSDWSTWLGYFIWLHSLCYVGLTTCVLSTLCSLGRNKAGAFGSLGLDDWVYGPRGERDPVWDDDMSDCALGEKSKIRKDDIDWQKCQMWLTCLYRHFQSIYL